MITTISHRIPAPAEDNVVWDYKLFRNHCWGRFASTYCDILKKDSGKLSVCVLTTQISACPSDVYLTVRVRGT